MSDEGTSRQSSKVDPDAGLDMKMETPEDRAYKEKKEQKRLAKQAAYTGPPSNFSKFLSLVFTWEFFIEFIILAIHPIPGYEVKYEIPILDMLLTKT